jgi:predicted DNA-binding protein with PD1-like motif
MQWKLLDESDGLQTFALVFDTGDEAMAGLSQFAREQRLSAAHFTAIGAFSRAVLAYFDWDTKQYQRIPVEEQVEVLALTGDVSEEADGKPKVHAHIVLGRRDGTTRGGHLMEGHVRPTLEVVLTESPAHLRRRHDPATGLSLIRLP